MYLFLKYPLISNHSKHHPGAHSKEEEKIHIHASEDHKSSTKIRGIVPWSIRGEKWRYKEIAE